MINPRHDSVFAFANPTHVRFIHEGLWGYWGAQTTNLDKEAYNVRAKFEIVHNATSGEGLFTTLIAKK